MTHSKFRFFNSVANDAVETNVFNLPKLMSSINRKEYRNVDNQGNAQLYTIGAKMAGTKGQALFTTAPNAYYVARAVKAWHDARVMMYKRAGIRMKDLKYGRSLRPYLDVNHENGTTTEIDDETNVALGIHPSWMGDEWTYSRAAVTTPQESVDATGSGTFYTADLTDTYSFTLLGDSVQESTTADSPDESSGISDQDSFVSVGMVAEWLDSFKKRPLATATDLHVDADNALLQLRSQQGPDKEEVLELVEEAQKEVRPWDVSGDQYYAGVASGFLDTRLSGSDYCIFQAPCGLFNATLSNTSGSSETLSVEFEVLDISDM